MTTLTSSLGEYQLWFGRAPQWKVTEGTYCSWNVFSRVDVRVSATFPGSTKMYLLTADGIPQDPSEDDEVLWNELFMSAMMRCLLLKDDDIYFMEHTRHENPFSLHGVNQFLRCFESLYRRGPAAGAASYVQVPNLSDNYMVDALYRLIDVTGLYEPVIEMLERIGANEILAQVLLKADREVDAVKLLVDGVTENPRNYSLLVTEADFCLSKERSDLALDCARRAVSAAPSDFYPWYVLCKIYLSLEQYDQVLLSLNSAPFIPFVGMDMQHQNPGKKSHRPLPTDGVLDDAWQFTADKSDPVAAQATTVQPALARLPGAQLRGCHALAYDILATLNVKLGWSELMKLRSQIFWMDAEPPASSDKPQDEANANAENSADDAEGTTPREAMVHRTLRSKRLCERRVDRLFMILFEDVRYYSAWQREAVHRESQKLPVEKSAFEWQMFGTLAERLHYVDQAKTAYKKSLAMFFNHRSLSKLLRFDVYDLETAVKLAAWYHRWYNEFSPLVIESLRKIVARDGLTKVKYQVEAIFGKQSIVQLIHFYLDNLAALKCTGYNM